MFVLIYFGAKLLLVYSWLLLKKLLLFYGLFYIDNLKDFEQSNEKFLIPDENTQQESSKTKKPSSFGMRSVQGPMMGMNSIPKPNFDQLNKLKTSNHQKNQTKSKKIIHYITYILYDICTT